MMVPACSRLLEVFLLHPLSCLRHLADGRLPTFRHQSTRHRHLVEGPTLGPKLSCLVLLELRAVQHQASYRRHCSNKLLTNNK